ncbi:hypothetical protein AMTRI_Chr12g235870 [Amborella trichopoda]|uniref:Uncharacterized protein n=1 Tax=Amborella trichopoda TaxID=13333 RepID=W1NLL9_AMBTC|nr:protein RBL [Amborella trichopoda]ERM96712.1 hypothetical protein AMTR_s00001p00273050 [Amborella trichopoda]|eukprot:XP_006829296.1 protein RBL [Amborella trichopoda]
MNISIIDPLQGDFPEVIEEFLQHGVMKCIAFNRRGTLLAAGCSDGSCVIWDFETRGIAKELRDKDCTSPITSISWSKYGYRLLASATDKSLTLWDVVNGEKIARATLQHTALHARLYPGSCSPTFCLACPLSSAPVLVDMISGTTIVLPAWVPDGGDDSVPHFRNKFADGTPPYTPTAASFNKHGDLVYVGNSKGEILIIDTNSIEVYAMVPVPGGAVIKNIVFSRSGQYLLVNSNDRTIRVYENHLPQKDAKRALQELAKSSEEVGRIVKLKEVGSKCLSFFREFQDSITRMHWKAPCFSGDGEWVVAASASKGEHKIFIWGRAGQFAKILEGPKEAVTDLTWHPLHPVVVSVSLSGLVYIWAKDYTENWSAFAPDFKELEENEEYVEREDEFDLMPETEKVKATDVNEDEEVDIMTVEGNSAFSDSDTSEEELCFLPTVPVLDVPEDQDKYLESHSKLNDSTHSDSPLSEVGRVNGPDLNPGSSPVEEDVGSDFHLKRKRKPSEKWTVMQAEKCRKPITKAKASTKVSKKEKKNGRPPLHVEDSSLRKSKSLEGLENGTCVFEDDVTDDY